MYNRQYPIRHPKRESEKKYRKTKLITLGILGVASALLGMANREYLSNENRRRK